MLHKESIEFSWEYPEFEFKEKTTNWYWYVGIVAAVLIGISIILANYLLGFLIIVSGFLMFKLATKEPLILAIEISQHGIKIHNDMIPYQNISAFWIGENKRNEPMLLFASNKPIAPVISVIIEPAINIMELREYLLEFIDEHEIREPLTDKIIDKIGF